jgi:hypothetical protein
MPFTPVTPQVPKGPGITSPAALALALAFVACDVTNGNSFPMTGKELLVIENTDTAAHTVTLTSVADAVGRAGDITAYSIPAGAFMIFDAQQIVGWQQSDGTFRFTSTSALLFAAVIRHS